MTEKRPKTPPPQPEPGEILASQAAEFMGLTAQAVGQWTAKPDAPVRRTGTRVFVRWPAFARWREQELCRQAAHEATAQMRKQLDAKSGGDPMHRRMIADARKAEIEVEQLERSMVRVEDAAAVTEKLLTDLRAALVPFPRTAAAKLIGAKSVIEMEQRLHREVVRIMNVLASPTLGEASSEPAEEAKEAA